MTLRLVGSAPTPIVRKPRPRLTAEQRDRLAVVLRNLHRLYGTWRALAAEMGMSMTAVLGVLRGHKGSMAMAVRAAELSRIPVERLLSGGIGDATACPHCGQKIPEVSP
jgi:hypothetical protein